MDKIQLDLYWTRFKYFWSRNVPLLGPLVFCTTEDHRSSIREFLIALIFASATFWLSAFFLKGLTANDSIAYVTLLKRTVASGELFIFSVAFLGPILILAGEDPKNARQFPGRAWHFLLLVCIAAISAGFFSLCKIDQAHPVFALLNRSYLFDVSLYIAVVACALRYLTMVYRRQTLDPERLRTQEEAFATLFAKRHPGGQ